ncbi:hypothetical protein CORC01_09647 [Colletotrichum orchidophilum]|uniref:Uncharacterized protein n=1 Tax=Colletotrichum orchidophilum TaxID=1209926 RepID=A0A1G4B0P2_9PEZI|nr:uncharacterized protein CORC01_09647 [Colletotrichum orchidophilum]OHE94990.1 hypothetical protein CORC01_09647 [Colletotrichum orchidophilum]
MNTCKFSSEMAAVTAAIIGTLAVLDTWDCSVSLGPASTIIQIVKTIIPGAAPLTPNGILAFWSGRINGTSDLVQTTLESWLDNSWCGAKEGQWCVCASPFRSFEKLIDDASAFSGTQKVKIEY